MPTMFYLIGAMSLIMAILSGFLAVLGHKAYDVAATFLFALPPLLLIPPVRRRVARALKLEVNPQMLLVLMFCCFALASIILAVSNREAESDTRPRPENTQPLEPLHTPSPGSGQQVGPAPEPARPRGDTLRPR